MTRQKKNETIAAIGPFISVTRGKVGCDLADGKKLSFKADTRGSTALGAALRKANIHDWRYSSSVDFPADDGGADIDMRSAIEKGWHKPCERCGSKEVEVVAVATWGIELCEKCQKDLKPFLKKALDRFCR
jgi:hypothetical protein